MISEVFNNDAIKMGSLYSVDDSLLIIRNYHLDQIFVDTWIDQIEDMSKIFNFTKIRTLSLEDVMLNDRVAYDIFHDFPNVTELRVLNSRFTSRGLNNLLTYLNPYSLYCLDLSGSVFESFDIDDFERIRSIICITNLILPNDMNPKIQRQFKNAISYQPTTFHYVSRTTLK